MGGTFLERLPYKLDGERDHGSGGNKRQKYSEIEGEGGRTEPPATVFSKINQTIPNRIPHSNVTLRKSIG